MTLPPSLRILSGSRCGPHRGDSETKMHKPTHLVGVLTLMVSGIAAYQTVPGSSSLRSHIPKISSVRPRSCLTTLKCVSEVPVNRRQAVNSLLVQIAAASFIQAARSETLVLIRPEGRPRNIIVTGANSGSFS